MTRATSQALNKSYGKERRKRCVFRRLRKTYRVNADVTWRGRSFQMRAAATGKARSPTVDSRVRWTGSDVLSADRRRVLIPGSGWLEEFIGQIRRCRSVDTSIRKTVCELKQELGCGQ